MRFENRQEAGRKLAKLLTPFGGAQTLVLALPRGGVPVGREVANALGASLDVLCVRKLGIPWQPEAGMGAIAEEGGLYLNNKMLDEVGVAREEVEEVAAQEAHELERRVRLYRRGRPFPEVEGKTVIVVDDGLATGGTMMAAVDALRRHRPAKVVLAVPVASSEALELLRPHLDDMRVVLIPESLFAIGSWYQDFRQVSDDEVIASLLETEKGGEERPAPTAVELSLGDGAELEGDLCLVPGATGLVLFAHGSGSSRKSPRNQFVAAELRKAGLATLLFDLLTTDEEEADTHSRLLRFDIDFLAGRLVEAVRWVRAQPELRGLRIGLFGASTGAAAALVAASRLPDEIGAVVSRGGRPDLATDDLGSVRSPTLLIVGGRDEAVLGLNRLAYESLRGTERDLVLVGGATHLFEEPGALAEVARLAGDWFGRHLKAREEREAPTMRH